MTFIQQAKSQPADAVLLPSLCKRCTIQKEAVLVAGRPLAPMLCATSALTGLSSTVRKL